MSARTDTDDGSGPEDRSESTIAVSDDTRQICKRMTLEDERMGDVVRRGLELLAEEEPERTQVEF